LDVEEADFMGVTVHIDNVSCRIDNMVPNLENSPEHFSLLEIHEHRHADGDVGRSEKCFLLGVLQLVGC
jgi:hypothetical protein